MLLLVRHAMPLATELTPANQWPLSPDGLRAADRLRSRLPHDAELVASDARRAYETVGGLDGVVERDSRFNEIARPNEPWGGDYCEPRRQYVEGIAQPGWEAQRDAAARFDAGVADLRGRFGDRPIVIGTHGMVLTVWLVSIGAVAPDEAAVFWAGLRFPDCIEARTDGPAWTRFDDAGRNSADFMPREH